MNENNINTNTENENEEVKNAIYSSKFLMSKALHYDFCSVGYHRVKNVNLFSLCLAVYLIGMNLLMGNYDMFFGFGLFVSFASIFMYFQTKKLIKISYERGLISAGKECTLNYELFDDKIVSCVDEVKREYFYHQITKLFETKNFILLHLQHNLYITIEKSSLSASVDEVKNFLINKCTLVKKKKFINCSNDKKWSLIFLIAIIAVSIIGTVVYLVLKMNTIF